MNFRILQKICSIEDCILHIPTGSQYCPLTNWVLIATIDDLPVDIEITGNISANNNYGFRIDLTNQNNEDYFGVGVSGGGYISAYSQYNSYATSTRYSANSQIPFKLVREGTSTSMYAKNTLIRTETNDIRENNQLSVIAWSSAKTVSYSDIKIKPL